MKWLDQLRFARDVADGQVFSGEAIPELVTVDGVIQARSPSSTGASVTRAAALGVPAVQRGRNLICSIATLPLRQYDPGMVVTRSTLLSQIDPQVPNIVTLAQLVEDLLFDSIGWWRVTARGWNDFPLHATRVDPARVHLDPPPGAEPLSRLPSGEDPRAAVWIDTEVVPGRDMIRFDSPNPPLLKAARRAIRRAIALEDAAALYASNPKPLDYFTTKEGQAERSQDEVTAQLDAWDDIRADHATGFVPGWLDYNSADSPTPRDLQLVELQARAALDIANAIGLDPEELGVSTTSRTYQNVTDRRRDKINDVLAMFMRAITDRLSMDDVTRQGYRVKFDLADYLKPDPITRVTYYEKMIGLKIMTPEEAREAEELPELTPAQKRAMNPPAPAAPPDPQGQVPNQGVPVQNTAFTAEFDGDEPTHVTFEASDFKADSAKRTVSGMLIPFNAVGRNAQGKWRFSPGSVTWNKSAISRVKLNRNHVRTDLLGAATDVRQTDAGVISAFKVGRSPAGDLALLEAEDDILDGLSAEVDILDFAPDPEDETVNLVSRAVLTGAALTATPAFDDARLTSVAASRDGGSTMPEATQATAPAEQAEGTAQTFTADQVREMIRTELAAVPAAGEGPAVVNPRRPFEGVRREESPYRFNGERGKDEFSADVFAIAKGRADGDTHSRMEKFIAAEFAVATTDVNELNPTRNRPDLYVDQRSYAYPVWDAINKGSIADATPFTVPKFNSAGTLVAAHTEGTEPSLGTFTTTNQTVTPAPSSGKIEINRETIDQGGNPQVSGLIWRQMQKAWFEALEAKAVAVLDAASPTAIALTAGAADDALAGEIEAGFIALQYVRGGFTMDNLFAQIDLYKALAAAVDGNGRKLYPIIAPQNANGTVAARYSSMDVAGVRAYPAWALAATGSVVASSYLFDSESVCGWATAPQRLDFDYQVKSVFMGLWGYAATAIIDINGVREITYDPVA